MIWLLFFVMIFWTFLVISSSSDIPQCPENFEDPNRDIITPRGYYGGVGYPIPFFDPLIILAGLAFIAFLVQTIHAIYHNHHTAGGLVGGVVDTVVPTKNRELLADSKKNEEILKAIEFYDLIHRKRKKKKKKTKRPIVEDREYVPVIFETHEKKT